MFAYELLDSTTIIYSQYIVFYHKLVDFRLIKNEEYVLIKIGYFSR